MAKVLVLYYSMYGHIETMARAVAEGASKVDGAEVVVKRVPETMPPQLFEKAGGKTQTAPVATPQELADYDAIILVHLPALATCPVKCVPSSTRRAACGLPAHYTENWRASLVPPVLAAVRNKPSHPLTTLAHHGMVIVPIGYAAQELFDVSQVRGGTPYGATTIAGGDGSRQPSREELSIARYQGEYVAGLAVKLNG